MFANLNYQDVPGTDIAVGFFHLFLVINSSIGFFMLVTWTFSSFSL